MKLPLILLAAIIISFLPCLTFAQHDAGVSTSAIKLTPEQWQADIRFLGNELAKRHRNAFHRLRKEDYDAAVKALYDGAPRMTEDEIIVGMMKIVAMIVSTRITSFVW